MKNIITKAKGQINNDNNPYLIYNLKENPFPSNPFVNQENSDKRYNGDIFEASIREIELKKIEENFLKVAQNNPNHTRIGYILDTSYVGRGNGKSSFAVNLLKIINKDFCLDITDNVNKCFGLYIKPEPSGKTRSFVNVLDLIAESLFSSKFIEYALAALRLDALINLGINSIPEEEYDEALIEKLNSSAWYKSNGIDLEAIHKHISQNKDYQLISEGTPFRKRYWSSFLEENHRIMINDDVRKYYGTIKKEKEKIDFIFNDLVHFFVASGFNGAYIIIDDFERIPDFQSDRQKRDFAMELRTNFFDGSSTNARIGFFNLIIMLHAGVPRLIEKAWADSGMDQRSAISSTTSASHVVLFNKLNKDHAILLLQKYLSEFRINNEDSFAPFTASAIQRIGEENEFNAAKMLKLSYLLLEHAAKESIQVIDELFVNKMIQKNVIEADIAETIIDEQSEDLLNKASK